MEIEHKKESKFWGISRRGAARFAIAGFGLGLALVFAASF